MGRLIDKNFYNKCNYKKKFEIRDYQKTETTYYDNL